MRYNKIPSRQDRGIDFHTWENVVRQTQKGLNLKFDPARFNVYEDATGTFVSADFTSGNGASFAHHFQVTANVASNNVSFDVAAGDWGRNGEWAHWETDAINPLTENVITAAFTGNVYAYAIRKDSQGGNDDIKIIPAGGEIESNNPYKMEELIASIVYKDGKIESVDQSLVGDIDDSISIGKDFTEFGIKVLRYGTDSCDVKFEVAGGSVMRRGTEYTVQPIVSSTISSNCVVYIDLGIDATTIDPSLSPTKHELVIASVFPTEYTYTYRFVPLYEIIHSEQSIKGSADGSTSKVYHTILAHRLRDGRIAEDWVRPDGVDTGLAAFDDLTPRAQTLDFCPDIRWTGTLQDRDFFKQVVLNDAKVFGKDADIGVPYYDVVLTTGDKITNKFYARVDSANAADHQDAGKSIEITGSILQLFDFYTTIGSSITDATAESPNPYLFLARDLTTTTPTLNYLDISNMKVADSYHADEADHATTADTANVYNITNYSNVAGYANVSNYSYTTNVAAIAHTALDFTGGDPNLHVGNTDHDFAYWNEGATYEYNHGQSIGRSAARNHDPSTATNPMAIDLTNSTLYDGAGTYKALDWVNKICYSNSGSKSIAWDAFQLYNYGSATKTLDWTTCELFSTAQNAATVDWENSHLKNNAAAGNITVDWADYNLVSKDGFTTLCWDISGTSWFINLANGNQWRPTNFDVTVSQHANVAATSSIDLSAPTITLNGQEVKTISGVYLTNVSGGSATMGPYNILVLA